MERAAVQMQVERRTRTTNFRGMDVLLVEDENAQRADLNSLKIQGCVVVWHVLLLKVN